MEPGDLNKLNMLRNTAEAIQPPRASSYKVTIDEEKMTVTITTPERNRIILDDQAQTIHIEDQHANKIQFSEQGIILKSTGDLTLKADGKLTFDGKAGVEIKTDTSLSQLARTITVKANTSLQLEGAAEAKINSSGITTIQGSLVKIN